MFKNFLVIAAAATLAACAAEPDPKPEPAPVEQPPAKAELVLDAPLVFFASNGQTAPYPFVKVTVRDGETHLLVDTSMGQHILTKRFASKVRAPVQESRKVGTVAGSLTPIEGRIGIEISGAQLDLESVYATEGQQFLEQFELGGYLAAARLSRSGTTIIDFGNGRLRLVEGPAELVTAWVAAEYPGLSTPVPLTEGSPVADASIGEREAVSVQFDTTGETTFESAYLDNPTPAGTPLADQAVVLGEKKLEGVTVAVANDVPDVKGKELVGTLGPEVLLSCVLVFDNAMKTFAYGCK